MRTTNAGSNLNEYLNNPKLEKVRRELREAFNFPKKKDKPADRLDAARKRGQAKLQKRADSLDDRMELQEGPEQQNRVDRLNDRLEAARKRGEAKLQKQKNYWKHRENMNKNW